MVIIHRDPNYRWSATRRETSSLRVYCTLIKRNISDFSGTIITFRSRNHGRPQETVCTHQKTKQSPHKSETSDRSRRLRWQSNRSFLSSFPFEGEMLHISWISRLSSNESVHDAAQTHTQTAISIIRLFKCCPCSMKYTCF